MKTLRCAGWTLLAALSTTPAFAQSGPRGYAFLAPGMAVGPDAGAMTLQVGGAAEGRGEKGFAAGVELGYVMPAVNAWSAGFGLLSPNVAYYAPRRGRVAPFVTAGYSLGFRSGVGHGWNVGAGFEMATRRQAAFRLEVRDQVFDWGEPIHFVGVRFGATFR